MDASTAIVSPRRGVVVAPSRGALAPVPLGDVHITGGFWAQRQAANSSATLAHCLDWMERLGWIGNFDRAAAGIAGPPAGREFSDSEIYKLLEALAWEASSGDGWAQDTYQRLTSRVIAAQQPDGYLNTRFGGPEQPSRYSDLEWGHELYCAGHLIQAGVARARTAGRDDLVDAVVRLADHIVATFGPDGNQGVCGHPEIELALVELSRVTGDRRYLEQARVFVERRGSGTLSDPDVPSTYFLDDLPVRKADVLRGHAVRALYLAAGAVDVAVETDDDELLDALRLQWRNTVARRTYLTGGMGSRHEGESFGDDYELPSDRAYSETCAGVGSIMFSWRMLLADGDAAYADLIERTLYNVIATSPDQHGTAFFYVNPLQRNTAGTEPDLNVASPRAASSQRAPWFEVSCCPTNIARTVASLCAYLATVTDSGLQLHQYASSTIRTPLNDGRVVAVRVETSYPHEGRVAVTVEESSDEDWTLTLRVPGWAIGTATLTDGTQTRVVDQSTVSVTRAFALGETIVLDLPVSPRITRPDDRIDALRGTAAIEAGPLVLCAESIDQGGAELRDLVIDGSSLPRQIRDGAIVDGRLSARQGTTARTPDSPLPYGGQSIATTDFGQVSFIPYYHWAERGPAEMRVWLPLFEPEASAGVSEGVR